MNRNLKRSLTILAASAALGVAAGLLIAPRRRNLDHHTERLYRDAAERQRTSAIADRASSAPARSTVVMGPYPHS